MFKERLESNIFPGSETLRLVTENPLFQEFV